MNKKGIIFFVVGLLLLGGVWVVSGMNYSTHASKDAFTRDFLDLEREAPEGYHMWVSKTNEYELLLPEDFSMISSTPSSYGRQGVNFEVWSSRDGEREQEEQFANLFVRYSVITKSNVSTNVQLFLSQHSYNGEHEVIETDEHTILYGKSAQVWDEKDKYLRNEDATNKSANVYFAFFEDRTSDRTLELFYSINCPLSAKSCPIDDETEEALFATIMDSVRFYEPSMVKEDE